MKKVWEQLGLEPWEYETNLLADEQEMDIWHANNLVVMRWMEAGNPKPLLAKIKKEGELRGPVLGLLVRMLEDGRLTFAGGRGRPVDPEAGARNASIADTYEDFLKDHQVSHEDLVWALGQVAGTGEETVRQAVTAKRKSKAKPEPGSDGA